jgi:tetratricopeptide (TPR) repeat protein
MPPQFKGGSLPYSLNRLATAYSKVGQIEKGLGILNEAFAIAYPNGELQNEPPRYWLKGQLTLQKSEVRGLESEVSKSPILDLQGEAEACFLKAIEIAQRQKAKSWELRAATSLARLWQQQGKKPEAHKLLSEVYNWFTEGFDTKDLQEAKALIEELNP